MKFGGGGGWRVLNRERKREYFKYIPENSKHISVISYERFKEGEIGLKWTIKQKYKMFFVLTIIHSENSFYERSPTIVGLKTMLHIHGMPHL